MSISIGKKSRLKSMNEIHGPYSNSRFSTIFTVLLLFSLITGIPISPWFVLSAVRAGNSHMELTAIWYWANRISKKTFIEAPEKSVSGKISEASKPHHAGQSTRERIIRLANMEIKPDKSVNSIETLPSVNNDTSVINGEKKLSEVKIRKVPLQTIRKLVESEPYTGVVKIIGKLNSGFSENRSDLNLKSGGRTIFKMIIEQIRTMNAGNIHLPEQILLEAEDILDPSVAANLISGMQDILKTYFPSYNIRVGWILSPEQCFHSFFRKGLKKAAILHLVPYPANFRWNDFSPFDQKIAEKMVRLARSFCHEFKIVIPFYGSVSIYDDHENLLFVSIDLDESALIENSVLLNRKESISKYEIVNPITTERFVKLTPGMKALVHRPDSQWIKTVVDKLFKECHPKKTAGFQKKTVGGFKGLGLFSWPVKKSFNPEISEYMKAIQYLDQKQ
ncbi:MAG: hypothetical protein CVV64_04320 [Candidatus Wallbacteria bacterium HGW-Wallbacteria-1]|uniref:Uncharacterized protein n=1 Tax=Candidatus Wallbacteria bacterium HGW-Wallbacteria-1 TaxID=2013854 RepID=A0A2N1PRN5_9BACT|nr:MAG: hypothetical protein CVV64_04320 [Candidatus Wallbacteria bacterium HGW-Wallbacteria-1]